MLILINKVVIALMLAGGYNRDFAGGAKVRVVELTNRWKLRNQNGTIAVDVPKIPSGVYTALSSQYGDVLQSKNDVELRWIAYDNWTYSKTFNVDQADYEHVLSVNLTLHGIDTVARISLNGELIGETDNMFVVYSFDVLPYLRQENTLQIEITSPIWAAKQRADALMEKSMSSPPNCPDVQWYGVCHRNMLRKMQASFGSKSTLAAPSMGIWKTVTLEYYEVAIMRDVDVAVNKNNTQWIIDARVFLSTGMKQDFFCELMFYAPDLLDKPLNLSRTAIKYAAPVMEFKAAIPKDKVTLWWPNGFGAQKLYPLFFSMNCWLDPNGPNLRSKTISQKSLKIGFRTLEVVEDADESGRTFYFKVNGHPIFAKGANYIPSNILPELSADQERIDYILRSAKEMHMNMIRVWGGGLYESDYFYSMADYYGLLVWQDMTFSAATYPLTEDFVHTVCVETSQNAKRIAHHPSLALIVTNDGIEWYLQKNLTNLGQQLARLEEEYKQLFKGTIKHELKVISRNEYNPRPGPMLSTPSMGIEESKKDLSADPQNINYGDIHFWESYKDVWNPDIYPHARFVSEYGFQSFPIIASWNRTLGANDTIANLMHHRQHDWKSFGVMLQLIRKHLSYPLENWQEDIEAVVYLSQVAQAIAAKTATQVFRSSRADYRTMGALYWQLNDVWIAPSWSSIDFYGNYKLLYYWSKEFLAPTSIIALYDEKRRGVNISLVRDDITDYKDPHVYDVTVNTYAWSKLYPKKSITWQDSNSVNYRFLPLDNIVAEPFTVKNCFLEFLLKESNATLASTFFFPSNFSELRGLSDPHLNAEISWRYCTDNVLPDTRVISYSITITVKRPALFVYIEINHPEIVHYKLSQNGFVQVEPVKIVHLEYRHKTKCLKITTDQIKVFTLNEFLKNGSGGGGVVHIKTSTTTTESTATDENYPGP